jgi:tripartite-type tricarboxylate transporter receptor subunit TctC
MKRVLMWSMAGAACLLIGTVACAQSYPLRPIRLVAPAAGGGVDFVSRLIAPSLSGELGQQVVIENRAGASGLLAVEAVLHSKPDGYTLLIYGPPAWINPLLKKNISYVPLRDIVPVGIVTLTANMLVVHPSLPVRNVRQLIALAKARPGELNDAGGDAGSSAHLAAELFKSMAGVSVVRVPYKGVGGGIIGLVSGEVQMMIPVISAVMPHVRAGRLRSLGVSTLKPTKLAPAFPTIDSTGLPGYVVEGRNALFAPAGTPAAAIDTLNKALNRVLQDATIQERLLQGGAEAAGGTQQAAARAIKGDMDKWGKVIADIGMKPE